ncbi:MAG: hypothetical protein GY716_03845 [bacterium]|nr:hypothetical protein [bacterium]
MKDFRVALAQISPRLGQLEANLELHLDALARSSDDDADVVVFPELSLTGYLLRDQVPDVALRPTDPAMRRLARASRKIDCVIGFVEESDDHRYYNSAGYFSGGKLVHVHRKLYLPTYGLFQEGRDFARGDRLRAFDAPFGRGGMLVCEDLWHSTCAWLLAHQGAAVIFVPANGPTRGTKPGRGVTSVGVWQQLLQVTAQFQTTFLVYVNRSGCEDGLSFGGGSMVVDPFGRTVATLPPLEDALKVVELKASVLRRARTAYPLLRDDDVELVAREVERIRQLRFDLPEKEAPAREEDSPRPATRRRIVR